MYFFKLLLTIVSFFEISCLCGNLSVDSLSLPILAILSFFDKYLNFHDVEGLERCEFLSALLFGRELRLPCDFQFGCKPDDLVVG